MFRRLPSETIKTEVHKRIYGLESPGNEITKVLIQAYNQVKKGAIICGGPIEGFVHHYKDQLQTDFKSLNSPQQVERQYICSAYSCLCAVIMTTQTKENLFSQYLFITSRDRNDDPSIWSLIVDQEQTFNFEVETNFNYVQLKNIEMQLDQACDVA